MIWNYDDSWRDRFETCEHRDILIVPHGTDVYEVPGGPPRVTSKIPKLNSNDEPIIGEYMPVEFVITNEDIYKEKFEYTNSLDTNEDLAFCGCESAMVKFTIRNNKTFDEDQGKYVLDIPNLQNYIITDENGTTLVGECQTHYIIKVYMYFDGDSSSLAYLGMFVVEEDKVSADGYTRDITAFDFLYTIRDMDIYYWYKHLFRGVSYKTNDFKDYFENRKIKVPEDYKPEPAWKEGWVRPARECWTIGEMLTDLIDNILTRYPSEKTVTNREKGTENNTLDDTSNVKQIDNHYTNDLEPYTGLALPMILDEDLFDPNAKYDIPTEPASNAHECYGYMDILNLKVYEDPKIMDAGALSAGKFLEDIGALAGRYPYIRLDTIRNDSYHDLHAYDENNPNTYYPYNLYEKCILTFKPLPDNDSKIHVQNYFDNSEIVKGFKHDLYASGTVHIWELYTRFDDADSPTFSYANLTKAQNKIKETTPSLLKKLQTSNNMFIDYLAVKKDDVKLAKDPPTPAPSVDDLLVKYAKVRNVLMYGEDVVEPVAKNLKNGLLHQGYAAIKYRTYTPYELTTFADPVREVGDRIKVNFEDKVTGEVYNFDTYILSRKISGIQKMMDTYVAKGNVSQQTFSNYKTGTTYSPQSMGYYGSGTSVSNASSSAGGTTFTGLTKDDFCEIIRNIGFRLLDEPESVSAIFVATSSSKEVTVRVINSSSYYDYPYQGESDIHTGDTTNPINVWNDGQEIQSFNVSAGDYFSFVRDGDGVEYSSEISSPLYLYDGSKWVYVGDNSSGGKNEYYHKRSNFATVQELENGTIVEGSECNSLTIIKNPNNNHAGFNKSQIQTTEFYKYGNDSGSETSLTVTPKYGDVLLEFDGGISYSNAWRYQYPGFWTSDSYPREGQVTVKTKPHVELKWSDPNNINSWEPKPCAWEGTVVIRKRNAAPLHRWDGELIVDSTTKDAYKDTAFIDDTIQLNRTYYYGFFPYYTAYTEDGHVIKYYRFTKTIRVSTGKTIDAPEIISIERIS